MSRIIIGILIPFFGTSLGSFMVLFMSKNINKMFEKILLGFSSGVMVSASIWSLLIPAIESSNLPQNYVWFPAVAGLIFGFLFLILVNQLALRLYDLNTKTNNCLKKKSMLVFAVSLHNIPEGMAVGVALAGAYFGHELLSLSSAFAVAVGIAIQNFPEGAIVSMPLRAKGYSRKKSFFIGVFSGIIEPIFAIFAFFVTGLIVSILPYILSFSAGAMLFVVIRELIPESQEGSYSNISLIAFALGFSIMMILDILL